MNSDHNSSELAIKDHINEHPMYEEYFNEGNQSVSKSSALSDNLQQHDMQPTLNVQPTLEPITPPSNHNAEDDL
ncbi:hypothetical protein Tco_0226137 [Tanacetum coccineum]